MTTLDRRNFIKVAAVGTGVVATGALAACSPTNNAKTNTKTASTGAIDWAEEYDVVVVGCGGAGACAALSALENDPTTTVAIFECASSIGGNSALNRGNYGAAGSDIQKKQGETDELFRDDSADLYFAEKCKLGDYRMDPKLTRIFADQCLEGLHWLQNLGIEFQKVGMYDESIPAPENLQGLKLHMQFNPDFTNGAWLGVQTKGRHHKSGTYKGETGGKAMITAILDRMNELGDVQIFTDSPVTSLIREEQLAGDVLGVYAQKEGKDPVAIRAKRGVILTAGGFSANVDMCRLHDPRIPEDCSNTGCASVDGAILTAAVDIGAETRQMDFIQHTFEVSAVDHTIAPTFLKRGAYINVDSEGKRFWKEMENKAAFRDARVTLLHELGHNLWWSVTDSAAIERLQLKEEAVTEALEKGITVKADTLEELAGLMEIDPNALQTTVDRWNGSCEAGVDEDFGQESMFLHSINKPPYYAEKRCYYIHSTPGGLTINENTQVIDRHNQPIGRLYAAGEITGGVHGTERNGGCSWTDCVVFGRIAGREASSETAA